MPKERRRRQQDEAQTELLRSCRDELVNLRKAVEKSTETIERSTKKSSSINYVLVFLTMAVFLTGFITIYQRENLPNETIRLIIENAAFALMVIALGGVVYSINKMRQPNVNSKKAT